MELQTDASSPIPIYHQIAEAIRYRVATGLLLPGQRLPSTRAAAIRWNVHFHTVRRAYQELAEQGIVKIAGAKGVTIGPRAGAHRGKVEKFIQRITRDASRRFGLSPFDLARCVVSGSSTLAPPMGPVYVLECSLAQCQDLAGQIRAQFGVDAVPWPLSTPDPLPAGEIVATLFHFNDLRRRCPQRLAGIHFVSIHLDPGLASRMDAVAALRVCDPDPEMTRNIAADLLGVFADAGRTLRIELGDGRTTLAPQAGRVQVVSPRLWGTLTDPQRRRRDIVQARYVFDQRELLELAARLGWPPARAEEGAA